MMNIAMLRKRMLEAGDEIILPVSYDSKESKRNIQKYTLLRIHRPYQGYTILIMDILSSCM